jgi:glycosyltransferase involved in cell wall biosynthesis
LELYDPERFKIVPALLMNRVMKTALVHDWLISSVGGAENSLKEIYSMFPSPIYTLVWNQEALKGTPFEEAQIYRSFIDRLPWSKKNFRSYLPVFPMAIEQFDLRSYDLILSSSHCVAKGIKRHPDQLHICYCYTPMRYIWDLSEEYLKDAGIDNGVKGAVARYFMQNLQDWDIKSSNRVDHFIAISHFVAERINRIYGRDATVIYPPVDTDYFQLGSRKEDFYLTSSRLVPYKKIHLIVEAFSKMPQRKLVVIGDGPEMKKICKIAGKNVELMGYQSNIVLREMIQKAKAFIFAAIEDFGIAPVEAMAAGTPVIALRKGGSVETVIDGISGLFFEEQSAESIRDAVNRFEQVENWDSKAIRTHALQFSIGRFREEYRSFIETKMAAFYRVNE